MKISSTSALVLNWSDLKMYPGEKTQNYIKQLDLSEGDSLLRTMDDDQDYFHIKSVSGRKYFMWKHACAFLKEHKNGQVVIMAAGIAPLSPALAEMYPESIIYDIDIHSMKEKSELLSPYFNNIHFIDCDITNTNELNEKLKNKGFIDTHPTMVIIEGIVYYLTRNQLLELLKWSRTINSIVIGDYCLPQHLVTEKNKNYHNVFDVISKLLSLQNIELYSREDFVLQLKQAGYNEIEIQTLTQIHPERTGDTTTFAEEGSSWIEFWKATE